MKRLVIKIGTNVLTNSQGRFNTKYIKQIIKEIAALHEQFYQIIIVSSGAIGAGLGKLNFKKLNSIREKQAVAAIGQSQLMHTYEKLFAKYNCLVAQILLTREDMEKRHRYLNVRNTLNTLLNYSVIPVINENDTVAVDEIKFGDNDNLSALVASKVDADILILLTDVAGLYTADPYQNKDATLIREVSEITYQTRKIAGKSSSSMRGTGGMLAKIEAAKIATASGVTLYIADGRKKGVIANILSSKGDFTRFLPKKIKISGRKRWIAFSTSGNGKIIVDKGACEAIKHKGKSLLPSGIIDVVGDFKIGDIISIVDEKYNEFSKGLVSYSASQIKKIRGCKTSEIERLLGCKECDEVVHRDNLVIL